MDPQEQTLLTIEQQEIADLKNRVATMEQTIEHMKDWMDHMSSHVGFSHPGWGS